MVKLPLQMLLETYMLFCEFELRLLEASAQCGCDPGPEHLALAGCVGAFSWEAGHGLQGPRGRP